MVTSTSPELLFPAKVHSEGALDPRGIPDEDRSRERPTSLLDMLPDRKTYLTSLSVVAFFSGLGIATVMTIKRGRREAAQAVKTTSAISYPQTQPPPRQPSQQQQQQQQQQQHHHHQHQPASTLSESDTSPFGPASSKGPFALFRAMNSAALSSGKEKGDSKIKEQESQTSAPNVLIKSQSSHLRGKEASRSVFDSDPFAPPPSVLMKSASRSDQTDSSLGGESSRKTPIAIADKAAASSEREDGDNPEPPVLVAIKALGVATALVCAGAWVSIELGMRLLGVRNVSLTDELVERFHHFLPSSLNEKPSLAAIGRTFRHTLGSGGPEDELSVETLGEEPTEEPTALAGEEPLPLEDALNKLDEAAKKGDASKWIAVFNRQLDAEMRRNAQDRRERIDAARI